MLIYIEGNIGCGKSTLLRLLVSYFKNDTRFGFVQEPVSQWTSFKDNDGENILDKFYKDQKKWSFPFQMNAFISRINAIERNNNEIKIIERSVYTDRYCFAKNCVESCVMNKIEHDIYCYWHDWLTNKFNVKPDGFIYLKAKPSICGDRIRNRARNEEGEIPIEYLENLHIKHEDWMKNIDTPVIEIDANIDYINDKQNLITLYKQIENFIETISKK